jgi:two-component system, NtrC family, response regulator AtoC
MARLYQLVERLAQSDLPVLVCGETGTGKELAVYALHQMSRRRGQPLVTLNCAAIQDTLVESELFGYERGAFSGAVATKRGLLESASGGTVFLDEIGELPAAAQAKLLRALETRRALRLGDLRERPIDIRVVGATNRDLAAEVAAGRFRQDLFFRLSGATLWLPPLRDRPRELPILAHRFLREACQRGGRPPMTISPAALRRLLGFPWPGNVRELKNVMEYLAAAIAEPMIEPRHLDERLGPPAPAAPPAARAHVPPVLVETVDVAGDDDGDDPMERDEVTEPISVDVGARPRRFRPLAEEIRDLERSRISAALAAAGGNQRLAAELLSMPLRTFVFKLRQYGLRRSDDSSL